MSYFTTKRLPLDENTLLTTGLDVLQTDLNLDETQRDSLLLARLALAIMICASKINEGDLGEAVRLTRPEFLNQSSILQINSPIKENIHYAKQTLESIPEVLKQTAENNVARAALVSRLMRQASNLFESAARQNRIHRANELADNIMRIAGPALDHTRNNDPEGTPQGYESFDPT